MVKAETERLFLEFLAKAFPIAVERGRDADVPMRSREAVRWDGKGGVEVESELVVDWSRVLKSAANKFLALAETQALSLHLQVNFDNGLHGYLKPAYNVFFFYLLPPMAWFLAETEPPTWDDSRALKCAAPVVEYLTADSTVWHVSALLVNVTYTGDPITLLPDVVLGAVGEAAAHIPWEILPFGQSVGRPVRPTDVFLSLRHTIPKSATPGPGDLFDRTVAAINLLLMTFERPIVIRSWSYSAVTWMPFTMSPSTPHPLAAGHEGLWILDDWELNPKAEPFLCEIFGEYFEPFLKAPRDVQLAQRRYIRAHEERNIDDQLLELMMALEALLGEGHVELSHRISQRLALLLGRNAPARKSLYHETKACYDLRSTVVHGGVLESSKKVQGQELSSAELMVRLRRSVGQAILSSLRLGLEHKARAKMLDRAAITADTASLDCDLASLPVLPWKEDPLPAAGIG